MPSARAVSSAARGTLRVDGVWRTYHDFYSQRADLTTGQVVDSSRQSLRSVPRREHQQRQAPLLRSDDAGELSRQRRPRCGRQLHAVAPLGKLRRRDRLGGPTVAQVNAYPEYKRPEWNSPEGDLAADQRHRARVWGTLRAVPMPQGAGSLTFGLLQQIGSGVPYGAVASHSTAATFGVPNPGYVTPVAQRYGRLLFHRSRCVPHRDDISNGPVRQLRAPYSARPCAAGAVLSRRSAQRLQRLPDLCGCGGSAFSNGGATDMTDASARPCGRRAIPADAVSRSIRLRQFAGERHALGLRLPTRARSSAGP